MALQFTPPPDWLIQDYYNRKDPSQVASEGIQNVLGTYMTLKNQQDVNALKQAENARQEAELRLKQEADRRAQGEYARNWDPSSLPGAGGAYNTYSPSNYGKASGPTLTQDSQMRSLLTQEGSSPSLRPSGTENVALNANDEESPVIARWNEMNANKGIGLGQNSSLAKAPANAQEEANLAFANTYPLGLKPEEQDIERQKKQAEIDSLRNKMKPEVPDSLEKILADKVNRGELTIEQALKLKEKSSGNKSQTGAQKAADRVFGAEYARYIAGGGYADVVSQIQGLEGVLLDLKGGKKNLSGPVITMQPDWARKRTVPDSMAAQQAVEQSVQRTLKQTLGGQFTEKEGLAFMSRGYDPALDEKFNVKKLERMIGQLKTMALAKQQAIDYYEEHGSLDGYSGDLYTLKNGEMVKTTKDDFYKMMGADASVGGGSTTSKKIGRFNVTVH